MTGDKDLEKAELVRCIWWPDHQGSDISNVGLAARSCDSCPDLAKYQDRDLTE